MTLKQRMFRQAVGQSYLSHDHAPSGGCCGNSGVPVLVAQVKGGPWRQIHIVAGDLVRVCLHRATSDVRGVLLLLLAAAAAEVRRIFTGLISQPHEDPDTRHSCNQNISEKVCPHGLVVPHSKVPSQGMVHL